MTAPAIGDPLVPGQVDTLSPLVRRILAPNPGIMTGQGTNTYLVGREQIAVIDPGPDDAGHLQRIADAGGGRICWILLTHTHPDHWPGAAPLAARTGAEVLAMEARDGLQINRALADGDRVIGQASDPLGGHPLDEFTLRAIHTPGHASNHLCFLLEQERLLFTGDQVMHGSTVVLYPPEGDVGAYLESLERLLAWQPEILALAPSHGLVFDDPGAVIRGIVDHRAAREEVIVRALTAAGGPVTVDQLLPTAYADVDPRRYPIARGSLWAHLRKLVDEGRATTTDYDDLDGGRWQAS